MARRYRSYAERIAIAKSQQAEAAYGKSYVQEFMELMKKAEKRREQEMPYLEDSDFDPRIGHWEIYHDPTAMRWTVYIEGKLVAKSYSISEAYDVVTNAILDWP